MENVKLDKSNQIYMSFVHPLDITSWIVGLISDLVHQKYFIKIISEIIEHSPRLLIYFSEIVTISCLVAKNDVDSSAMWS